MPFCASCGHSCDAGTTVCPKCNNHLPGAGGPVPIAQSAAPAPAQPDMMQQMMVMQMMSNQQAQNSAMITAAARAPAASNNMMMGGGGGGGGGGHTTVVVQGVRPRHCGLKSWCCCLLFGFPCIAFCELPDTNPDCKAANCPLDD